jgi:hypothetical protein
MKLFERDPLMLRATRLAVIAILVCGAAIAAADDSSLGNNAALKYWQAFATLPKFADEEQSKLTSEYPSMRLDAHARELVANAEYSLRMLHRGAALRPCSWGIGYQDDGAETRLPQLSAARVLSALAGLRARIEFAEGRPQAAVDDLVAALALGRQVSLDGSLIAVLVGYAVEDRTGATLAANLTLLNADALRDLQGRLKALPPGGRPATAMKDTEANFMIWIAAKVSGTKNINELLDALINMGVFGNEGERLSKARAVLDACGGTKEGFLKQLEALRGVDRLLAQKLDLDFDQSEKALNEIIAQNAANPLLPLIVPSVSNVRRAQARSDIRRALLETAIDMQLHGRDALKNHTDPVTHTTFEFGETPGGFELRSTWKQTPPLTLEVGNRSQVIPQAK